MRISFLINSNDAEPVTVDIDEPLSNGAGRIVVRSETWATYAEIKANVDSALKAAGITTINSVSERRDVDGKDVVNVDTNKGQKFLLLSSRPDLLELVENREAINSQIGAPRRARAEAESKARREADDELRAGMRAQAEELAKQIPAGHIRCDATWKDSYDSGASPSFSVDGEKLCMGDYVLHGWASAIRPGAMNAFDHIPVASISPEKLAEVRARNQAAREKSDAEQAAKRAAREEKAAKRAALENAITCSIIKQGKERGEEWDPYALVELTYRETGEKLQFRCRNIFDFGYTVNPAYSIVPGQEPGGLANDGQWQTFETGKGWFPVRPLTTFEKLALQYLAEFPPISTEMRM